MNSWHNHVLYLASDPTGKKSTLKASTRMNCKHCLLAPVPISSVVVVPV